MIRNTFLLLACLFLAGCFMSSKQVGIHQAVLLPEDRVFTLAQGTQIDVMLDGKKIKMTFPVDMKLVSSSYLVRQEQVLNKTALGKTNADKKSRGLMAILGSIGALLASLAGYFFKARSVPKKRV